MPANERSSVGEDEALLVGVKVRDPVTKRWHVRRGETHAERMEYIAGGATFDGVYFRAAAAFIEDATKEASLSPGEALHLSIEAIRRAYRLEQPDDQAEAIPTA